jgi:hypothetical protein
MNNARNGRTVDGEADGIRAGTVTAQTNPGRRSPQPLSTRIPRKHRRTDLTVGLSLLSPDAVPLLRPISRVKPRRPRTVATLAAKGSTAGLMVTVTIGSGDGGGYESSAGRPCFDWSFVCSGMPSASLGLLIHRCALAEVLMGIERATTARSRTNP